MSLPALNQINSKRSLFLMLFVVLTAMLFSRLTSVHLTASSHLIAHTVFELASIILGFIIFFIAWYRNNRTNGTQITVISLVILATSILDIVHVLTFPGMPGADNGADSQFWLNCWIFARIMWSLGLFYAVCIALEKAIPYFPSKTPVVMALLLFIGFLANAFLSNSIWPFPEISSGSSPIIALGHCFAAGIDLAALAILRYSPFESGSSHSLQIALIFAVLTDLSFAFAIHTAENLNFSGHFFKVLSYYFVLNALFIVAIRQPYEEIISLKEKMENLALNNEKLYQESEQQRSLVEDTLAKIGMIISSQLDFKDTVDAIADMVADMMHSRQSLIALLHKDHSSLQVVAAYGFNAPPEYIPLKGSLAGQVFETKTAGVIDDLTLHPELFRPQLIFSSIRSQVCAPLVNDGQIIGVIEAYSSAKGAFSERNALLLQALGHHAGAAVFSALQYQELKIRLDEEKFLHQIAQATAASIDPDVTIQQCSGHVLKALGADYGIGLLAGEKKQDFILKAALGLDCNAVGSAIPLYPALAKALELNKPSVAKPNILAPFTKESTVRHALVLPLTVDASLAGVIIVGWKNYVSPERLEDLSFPQLMAQQIALGLEKAHLYNQIKAMALSDGLTGLANRRNFDMFLTAELRRATILKRPLSLIMFDLDKFKLYNDTYGHLTGDKLLAQIGQILHNNIRSIDFPARYGGEEFSIILPECKTHEAVEIAEKIRISVENGRFPDNYGTFSARITASLGVATYDPSASPSELKAEELIALADKALYQAKHQGRNRVVNAAAIA